MSTALTTDEILRRAVEPGMPLHGIVAEVEQKAQVEREAAEAALVERQEIERINVEEQACLFEAASEARWEALLALVALDQDYREKKAAYEAAIRVSRSVGVEHNAIRDKLVQSRGGGPDSYPLRQQVDSITALLRRGVA
jgi:hypothetical protein